MNWRIRTLIILIALIATLPSCKKYLDARPDKKLAVVNKLADMQALIDKTLEVNYYGSASLEASADNYFITPSVFTSLPEDAKNMYLWNKDYVFPDFGSSGNEWSYCYDNVYKANTILGSIENVNRLNQETNWDDIKGQAYFLRARSFAWAVWVWSAAYDESNAKTQLGIPLRKGTDFNVLSKRATLEESYEQLISDLKMSIPLLPVKSVSPVRASKPAAYGLLAKVYLSMRNYANAKLYADSCLLVTSELMDYNSSEVTLSSTTPFKTFNKEVIFESGMSNGLLLARSIACIDSTLFKSYADNDLRKQAFFLSNGNGTFAFKGSYSNNHFNGIATDEMYFIRAECKARAGDVNGAMEDMDTVLNKRWKTGTYIPFTAADQMTAINLVLLERRKELVMRGVRWVDIKRLNLEGANISLRRVMNNMDYILPPNDPRYAMPVPEQVIALSGMPQNPR